MTTGVFAWMLWRIPVGMWTQVPGLASSASSPSVSFASPWRKCRTAGIEAVCSDKLLALAEAEDDRLDPVVVVQGAAQDALIGRLNLLRQIADVRVGGRHCGTSSFFCPTNMTAAR